MFKYTDLRPQESVRIAHDIAVKVIKTTDTRVELGVEAPRDFLILRGEILARDDREKPHANEKRKRR